MDAVTGGAIAQDDPRAAEVRDLLERHLELMRSQSPPEDVHALDVDGLVDPAVAFYCGPFADYRPSPNSVFMTLKLG
jgi:hypothetical protein